MAVTIDPRGGVCHWCGGACGGTCLSLTGSTQMKADDPAYWMLKDGHTSTPKLHREGCYICEDPEFAQMGLPLCQPCPQCMRNAENEGQMGHIPADDEECDDCGYNAPTRPTSRPRRRLRRGDLEGSRLTLSRSPPPF